MRQIRPTAWIMTNLERITSWLKEHEIECRPVAPLGCGWFLFFNPGEETLKILRKAETCKPFDIDDTGYPSLEYMEDEPEKSLESKALWLMVLRSSLEYLYAHENKADKVVLSFHDYLIRETERVMEMIKQGQK